VIRVRCSYLFYFLLKNQNFGSWMAVFKFWLIVSFYHFLIKKYNCPADKQLNWHCYIQQHDQAWTWNYCMTLEHNSLIIIIYILLSVVFLQFKHLISYLNLLIKTEPCDEITCCQKNIAAFLIKFFWAYLLFFNLLFRFKMLEKAWIRFRMSKKTVKYQLLTITTFLCLVCPSHNLLFYLLYLCLRTCGLARMGHGIIIEMRIIIVLRILAKIIIIK